MIKFIILDILKVLFKIGFKFNCQIIMFYVFPKIPEKFFIKSSKTVISWLFNETLCEFTFLKICQQLFFLVKNQRKEAHWQRRFHLL